MKVIVVGASGETGTSVVHGLIKSAENIEVTALARKSSLDKPEYLALKDLGVTVSTVDLSTVSNELVALLTGADVVISCLTSGNAEHVETQNNLASACKKASVGRFVPSFFGPICPPRGIMLLRNLKEDLLDHIKSLYLPYTVIDVGWWYQLSLPPLPSGRLANALTIPVQTISGDGNTETALIDKRDIGKYVARIIVDPRTLNKSVFVFNEIWTQNRIFDLMEKLSGEEIPRSHVNEQALQSKIKTANEAVAAGDITQMRNLAMSQYELVLGIRGDNSPERAKYLGYLIGKDLYPDLQGESLEQFINDTLAGKIERLYARRR
ncbi:unnamed protein product [Clonostachys rosea f. rosea IK726]|uniref:NmrA-like domain-containing protein n=2 Tax=Bionectria ochroleuca TaxID=29856 RepID=A0A0B7KGA1_BIOOC|nr:unnamed protein product [Clonostachys rosea f. rosea IK726]